jgi:hypothetical protein
MLPNILAAPLPRALLAAAALAATPGWSSAQIRCSSGAGTVLERGWAAYRADSNRLAAARFEAAHRLCPKNIDAQVGLGFAWLRLGRVATADSLFRALLARTSTNSDVWEGRARAALRLGDTAAALTAARRGLALAPENQELRSFTDRFSTPAPPTKRGTPKRPATLQLSSRTQGAGFEVYEGHAWRPFYIRGVNFGVALPGRFPTEFPEDSSTYKGWLETIAAMHANALRVYTILPPSFYRALRTWNLGHPDRPLWLIHGVWVELPPSHDFAEPAGEGAFQAEMRRVVDVIHGAASIERRPGHASGTYDADVSSWVLAYIVGREWEPFAVEAFAARRPGGRYSGRYLQARAPAMELWLARQCDVMLGYEVDTYNAIRPIAYTNWPTLDPLDHPTEATTALEDYWRRRTKTVSEARLEYENDAIGLDANLIQPTFDNPAGWFASYHVYPYYPDFISLEPRYRHTRSAEGPSNYYGYLRDLVGHHRGIPIVIAEYGVPSSRGMAHWQAQGWQHGGHDERAMAAIDARLTREIKEAGAAGSVIFAWMDEWFKKNWAVIEYEIPRDNTRLWHNVMDPEQNYGILGQYSRRADALRLGGDPAPWRALPQVQQGGGGFIQALRAAADESYMYLAVELRPGAFAWNSLGIEIALDTYLPRTGQHRLPRSGLPSEIGFEFLIDLAGPDSATLRVTPDYQRHDAWLDPTSGDDFGRFSRRPVITRDRSDARFDSLFIITNRARFGRDGTFYPSRRYDRGVLRHGSEAVSTLRDWYLDEAAGLLQLRIPWDLLNVTDPSTRTLLFDRHTEGAFGTVKAEDFHVGLSVYRKGTDLTVVDALPEPRNGMWRVGDFDGWQWHGWTKPQSHARLKPVYDSLKALWEESPSGAPDRPSRRVPSN